MASDEEVTRQASDVAMDMLLGTLLRVGVTIAALLALVGGIVYLGQHAGDLSGHHVFAGEPAALRRIPAIVAGAGRLDGRALIQLGLLTLIATPILRVAVSLVAFARMRDRTYVIVTAIVLTILAFGLFSGGIGG